MQVSIVNTKLTCQNYSTTSKPGLTIALKLATKQYNTAQMAVFRGDYLSYKKIRKIREYTCSSQEYAGVC